MTSYYVIFVHRVCIGKGMKNRITMDIECLCTTKCQQFVLNFDHRVTHNRLPEYVTGSTVPFSSCISIVHIMVIATNQMQLVNKHHFRSSKESIRERKLLRYSGNHSVIMAA